MKKQLILNILLRDGFRFDSFYYGKGNAELISSLQQLSQANLNLQLLVWGESQSGKSHLLQSCCYSAAKNGLRTRYLPLKKLIQYDIDILSGLEQADLIAIDDIDAILGKKRWEETLIKLINETCIQEKPLLLSSLQHPYHLNCQLIELPHRLRLGETIQIHPLSDHEKMLALQARARQRGFELKTHVMHYIFHNYSQDLNTLFYILNLLDRESIREQRIITIPFVKKILENRKENAQLSVNTFK